MALPLPRSLSPSKVSTFKDCALAFRFSAIDRIPEPPSPHMLKGTIVHRALEGLFWNHPRGRRSPPAALAEMDDAWSCLSADAELDALGLSDADRRAFRADAEELVLHEFELEDPDAVDAVGVELVVEADMGGMRLRGIIDRLDRAPGGGLVVVDYKTGRVPGEMQEHTRLAGVQFYALLCEQVFGQRPIRVELLYLRKPVVIGASPTDQSLRGTRTRTAAVWQAIGRACATEDFRPHPSALCRWCAYRDRCPAMAATT